MSLGPATRRIKRRSKPASSAIEPSIRMLANEVAQLRTAIDALSERIAEMNLSAHSRRSAKDIPERGISDAVAKEEIKAYFEQRHGETVYPSDVAEDLDLDYDRTIRLIGELESDGRVARV
jgi:hypothetical protein